jgi:hypothetical protein
MRSTQFTLVCAFTLLLEIAAGAVAVYAAPDSSGTDQHHSDAAIGLRVGTPGFGLEASKLLTPHLGARVGGNYFKLTKSQSQSDISYDASLTLQGVTALIDFFPARRGSFHLSGGLMTNPLKATGTGQPAAGGSFTINGNSYTSAQVGTLIASVKYPSASPYLGLGIGTPARGHSPLGIAFDLGVAIGKPKVELTATGAAGNPALAADLQAQQDKTQKDVEKLKVFPVLQLGLAYHF